MTEADRLAALIATLVLFMRTMDATELARIDAAVMAVLEERDA